MFTSDLFGSYGSKWDLYIDLDAQCAHCPDYSRCPRGKSYCPLPDLLRFHQRVIPSERILRFSLQQLAEIPFTVIAPQHGSVITGAENIAIVWDRLASLDKVGIDGIIGDQSRFDLARKPQP